jgi:DNA-binding transcriptional LysR family regulator
MALDPQFPLDVAAAALKDLNDAYPSVDVRVLTASLGEALAALQERRCTLAISGIEIPDPHIEREALWFHPRAAVAAATHPLAKRATDGNPISTAVLADHIQIVGEDPSPLTEGRDFGVLSPGTWRVTDNATKHALIMPALAGEACRCG